MPDIIRDILEGLIGERRAGGCDDCDAYQVVSPSPADGVYHLTVYHDDDCPTLRAHTDVSRETGRNR